MRRFSTVMMTNQQNQKTLNVFRCTQSYLNDCVQASCPKQSGTSYDVFTVEINSQHGVLSSYQVLLKWSTCWSVGSACCMCLQGDMTILVKFGGDPITKNPFTVGVAAPLDLSKVNVDNLEGSKKSVFLCIQLAFHPTVKWPVGKHLKWYKKNMKFQWIIFRTAPSHQRELSSFHRLQNI